MRTRAAGKCKFGKIVSNHWTRLLDWLSCLSSRITDSVQEFTFFYYDLIILMELLWGQRSVHKLGSIDQNAALANTRQSSFREQKQTPLLWTVDSRPKLFSNFDQSASVIHITYTIWFKNYNLQYILTSFSCMCMRGGGKEHQFATQHCYYRHLAWDTTYIASYRDNCQNNIRSKLPRSTQKDLVC